QPILLDGPGTATSKGYYLQRLVHLGPIHDAPPRADVVGPAVLVLQVIRVFPHVEPKDGRLAFHQRVVLVRRTGDRELGAVLEQPHPAAAETSGAGLAPLLLERVEAAKRAVDGVGDLAGRRAAGVRCHPRPEPA